MTRKSNPTTTTATPQPQKLPKSQTPNPQPSTTRQLPRAIIHKKKKPKNLPPEPITEDSYIDQVMS